VNSIPSVSTVSSRAPRSSWPGRPRWTISALDDLHVAARQDGDAVPGLLTQHRRAVARGGKRGVRKLRVVELQLLESHHIGTALLEPAHDELEPRAQAVDVPRGQSHRPSVPDPAPCGQVYFRFEAKPADPLRG